MPQYSLPLCVRGGGASCLRAGVHMAAARHGLADTFTRQSLAQRVKAFGIDHPDSVKQWKKLNTEYNVAAMKLLQSDDYETALGTVCTAEKDMHAMLASKF